MALLGVFLYFTLFLFIYVVYKKWVSRKGRGYELSHLGIHSRGELKSKLLDSEFALLESILAKNATSPALEIIFPAFNDQQILYLSKKLILKDIQNTGSEDSGVLFRSNTSSTVLWNIYCQRNGSSFLNATLSDGHSNLFILLRRIISQTSVKPFEVNPDFLENTEDLNTNRTHLKFVFNEVFNTIILSEKAIPKTMRKIFFFLFEQVKIKFPQYDELAVGNFFFLRFICPCLLIPQQYNITKDIPPASAQRTLTLIAKLLQVLANQQVFQKKEEYLICFNEVIESKRKELSEFINKITKLEVEDNEDFIPPLDIEESVLREIEAKLKLLVKL